MLIICVSFAKHYAENNIKTKTIEPLIKFSKKVYQINISHSITVTWNDQSPI